MTELGSVYNPQRQRANEFYNKNIGEIAPQEDLDLRGLEQAKENAFSSISTGANRRGMLFSGIPLAEQGKYVGENYLPSIAGLKNRYAGIRGNLYQTLASQLGDIDVKQREFAQGIYNSEVQADIERERIAAAERQAAADRAAAAANAGSSSGGGTSFGGTTSRTSTAAAPQQTLTRRQQWQNEANAGDWDAQVALNYLDDNGRYDGPVNSLDEYRRLKSLGAVGNFYYAKAPTSSGSGLKVLGGSNGLEVR
jgi:hypothetical protein